MPSKPHFDKAICWIRRDLRLTDHAPLEAATRLAKQVAAVFVFDTTILEKLEDRGDKRLTFIHRSLEELDRKLRRSGSRLVVLHGDPRAEIPSLARKLNAEAVFAGKDYEPMAIERDASVRQNLVPAQFVTLKDHVVFEGLEVATREGHPYRVYSPYKKAWLAQLRPSDAAEARPDYRNLWPREDLDRLVTESCLPSIEKLGFERQELWLDPGEDAAQVRLSEFVRRLPRYREDRDYPGIEGTSGLSAHFRFGTLSIRTALRAALGNPGPGSDKWLSELIWREFYQMILDRFPYVVQRAFQQEYEGIEWPGDPEHFEAWKAGQTGFPIVDAAMRCLNATGWMHNRLRMVAASFLVKDLLVDWRLGEAYFARKLLDFDLAQNNGGWQWCASTGVDAQPAYRIFNPVLQSRKFDPDGRFIRQWCPELAHLSDSLIHWPHEEGTLFGPDYPKPIVRHEVQRVQALNLLSSARTAAGRLNSNR